MLSKFIARLEARFGRHRGVRNLMGIVVGGTVLVYLADFLLLMVTGLSLSAQLSFNRTAILQGQIWRLVTFVFVPTGSSHILLLAINLYFDWLMGEMLQSHWGTFRFNLFYFTGLLGTIISGMITGYATAYYLNLSLMLAMACIQPEMPLQLYGIIKIPLKWLALFSLAMMLLPLLSAFDWRTLLCVLISLINVLLFLADRLMEQLRNARRRRQWKNQWRDGWRR